VLLVRTPQLVAKESRRVPLRSILIDDSHSGFTIRNESSDGDGCHAGDGEALPGHILLTVHAQADNGRSGRAALELCA